MQENANNSQKLELCVCAVRNFSFSIIVNAYCMLILSIFVGSLCDAFIHGTHFPTQINFSL